MAAAGSEEADGGCEAAGREGAVAGGGGGGELPLRMQLGPGTQHASPPAGVFAHTSLYHERLLVRVKVEQAKRGRTRCHSKLQIGHVGPFIISIGVAA